ncbi:hypothetical protein [Leifsonia virtsii]|uniref:hypothetical protein n=1 Tax=Leifsonia virtsii TaxID=3035915 RepID=UPI00263BA54D|nr:hypothetical protein [Leifsonia virtsii]
MLDEPMRSLAARLPGAERGVLVVPEFSGPIGVADMVALVDPREELSLRLEAGIPPVLNLTLATVAAAVSAKRTTTLAAIGNSLQMSERQVSGYVRSLEAQGVIEASGSGFRRHPRLRPVGRLFAFEAKVSEWRKASHQAVRYASWSDAVAIVLLTVPRDSTDMLAAARRLRIGVAHGDRWLVQPNLPRRRESFTGARLVASERIVATAF